MPPAASEEITDARFLWLEERITSGLKAKPVDVKKLLTNDESKAIVASFWEKPELPLLFISNGSTGLQASLEPLAGYKKKAMFFLRTKAVSLTADTVDKDLYVFDISTPLESLSRLAHDVYFPLLKNKANLEAVPEVIGKEVMETLQRFMSSIYVTIGQIRGTTLLPLPAEDTYAEEAASKDKEKVHALESAVVTWTRQIKNVLKMDPEMALKGSDHPGPLKELEFWSTKSENLNAIFEQLAGDKIQKILNILEVAKSTYVSPFQRLVKEVEGARDEANDNLSFLAPLKIWFEKISTESSERIEFPELHTSFRKMIHLLYLVWKHSKYYNTPTRLVVVIREIANAIIANAREYVNTEEVFKVEAAEAVERLKLTLKVCGSFKDCYFDYKTRVSNEIPNNPWRIQHTALFSRLDNFLERCHDILDLLETVVQFSKLEKIEIGGTKGKTLSQSVEQIHHDFQQAFEKFQHVPYDLLDVESKQFDDDFYEFRCVIKELERRLGSILSQGFDDCSTVFSAFKLVESFEGLLEREIIQADLEKKQTDLLRSYGTDLKHVQEIFGQNKETPPVYDNMPPTAGALIWCRGLLDRVVIPMEKFQQSNKSMLETDEARELLKSYEQITESLREYERAKYQEWSQEVGNVSAEKLKQYLLRRDKDSNLLYVNFDPALVRLLREVSYLEKINADRGDLEKLPIPKEALDIFKKAEVYRTQTGKLELIVNMYNGMLQSLLEVEKPLLETQMKTIDEQLQKGISSLNWKGYGIDDFIAAAMTNVRDANTTLSLLKNNVHEIEKILALWASQTMFERKEGDVYDPVKFETKHKELMASRESKIREGGVQIHQKLADSFKALKDIGKGSVSWKNYVDYANGIVVDGIRTTILSTLKYLRDQIDPESIVKNDLGPLLEVQLELVVQTPDDSGKDKSATFSPALFEADGATSIQNMCKTWMKTFCHIGVFLKRLDTGEDDYIPEINSSTEVQSLVKHVEGLVSTNAGKCSSFREQFLKFSFLWTSDVYESFEEFLSQGENGKDPRIGLFDEQIIKYEQIQSEIHKLPNTEDIGWLRIDAKPIKNALASTCGKWKASYTGYLADKVSNSLTDLRGFIELVDQNLNKEVQVGDMDTLLEVMGYIRDVRLRSEATDAMFDPLRDIVSMLKRHDVDVPEEKLKDLDNLPLLWNNLKKKTFSRREELSPLQDQEAKKVKDQMLGFNDKVSVFRSGFQQNAPFEFDVGVEQAYDSLDEQQLRLCDIEKDAKSLQNLQELFELNQSEYKELSQCRSDIVDLKGLWDFISLSMNQFSSWMSTSFKSVDVDYLVEETKKLMKDVKKFPSRVKFWGCYTGLEKSVANMLVALPLVQELRSPAMRDRHWKGLLRETKTPGSINPDDDSFSLKNLLDLGLHRFEVEVLDIVDRAKKELGIEKNLKKIEETWVGMVLAYEHDEALKTYKVADVGEIVEVLEDNQVMLQNMQANKFVEYFDSEVKKWLRTLGMVMDVITLWTEVQRSWSNLYPIFILSADIREQLPNDSKRFSGTDAVFRQMMEVAKDVSNVVEVCTHDTVRHGMKRQDDMYSILSEMQGDLEKCEKALSDYLETKRRAFPRFYFVSSSDLVDILSKGSTPHLIMKHMSKLIDSVDTLDFRMDGEQPTKIAYNMISKEGEEVPLAEDFNCEGAVEDWLTGLIKAVADTLRAQMGDAYSSFSDLSREQFLRAFPAQLAVVAARIWWTFEVNKAFERLEEGDENAMKEYNKAQVEMLNNLADVVAMDLDGNMRRKVITLITVEVHARDVVTKLVESKVDSPAVFDWQSQLRYTWSDEKGCVINIADAVFYYNYEYIGNCGCLVITPLTDRCYITLTQALRLIMGGAPAGPAGTGKTETTKDLARALGNACYVFNCSEQMDYRSLGNIFKGLCMTGAWGCFDEFNRIPIEVLSVVATQFKSILDALSAKKTGFVFQGEDITLISTVGVFITMNPGYKGRTELPENLKALFRPCAMVVPDLENICEIMLASEGFKGAKGLAKKFVTLYMLNRELLSKQDHYDWGLRAIKSVLVIAGSLKRAEPSLSEELILMRALRDTNMAKLARDDIEIFKGLISDLFPNMDLPPKVDPDLEKAVREATEGSRLQPGENDMFILKAIQLKELLDVRHSVFVLGPGGAGKSAVWKTLAKALTLRGQRTQFQVLDPKAITSDELYGYIHKVTREWKDGILSVVMRNFADASKANKNPKWIVLDGDIDPEWIESMNTVMDDNKVLTLASNERIPLTPSMRMLFEISHLKNATPATVSRAGILFLNETDVGWEPFKDSWIEGREEKERGILDTLFSTYVTPILRWIRVSGRHIIPRSTFNMIQTLCRMLEGLLKKAGINYEAGKDVYEMYFVYACVWSFGGALDADNQTDFRLSFSNWFKKEFAAVKYPDAGTVFDYFVEQVGGQPKLSAWVDQVSKYVHNSDVSFGNIVVQTVDTVRLTALMNMLQDMQYPVMFIGTAGTGKTTIVKEKLNNLNDDYCSCTINFNSNSRSIAVQSIMESMLEKKAGIQYGPPGRKRLIFYVDDLNMPNPDKYGTQSAISFLRQHMDYGFWYDRGKIQKKEVTGCQYITSMNPKAGSFTVDDRFQRHFAMFSCFSPSTENLKTIYFQILDAHLQNGFSDEVCKLSEKVVDCCIDLHTKVARNFLPTAIKFHYQFNLRELSNIFQGILRSRSSHYAEPQMFMRLVVHECTRVYNDRLVEASDTSRFQELLRESSKKFFDDQNQDELLKEPIVFTSFIQKGISEDDRIYVPVKDFPTLRRVLNEKLREYNETYAVMDLELFEQALEHVCRITRIIDNPRGNALLVGVGGSGKQSLSRLAAFICGYETFQITVTSNYGINEFKLDLIELYKKTGLKGLPYVFLMTDGQIVEENMLVYLNDLLSSGYIPDMFTPEEKDGIIGSISNEVKQAGLDYNNKDVCFGYFIDKVRRNLHVVLCFSPIGDQFRVRCRQFPALTNCTAIDWFHAWPREALVSVAGRFLQNIELPSDELRDSIAHHMAFVHQSVGTASEDYRATERRYNYVTPKSFLELISLYGDLLSKKRSELTQKIERLETGLAKLRDAASQVADLQEKLKAEQVIVEEKRRDTEQILVDVGRERNIVEEQTAQARVEEEKTNTLVSEVDAFKKECEADLAKAEPIVQEALAALNTLDKKSLTELKSFTKPADEVVNVTAAVMILLTEPGKPIPKDLSWNSAKKMMAQVDGFLKSLIEYDKEHIPQQNVDAVAKFVDMEGFTGDQIRSKSFAAAGLCEWVRNIVKFHFVNLDVEPKRQKLAAAEAKLDASQSFLRKVQDQVAKLQAKLDALLAKYEAARQEKMMIEERAAKTQQKLNLAERLVNGLADENVRWAASIQDLKASETTLIGNVLVAAGFLSYIGPFSRRFRESLMKEKWIPDMQSREIPFTPAIDPLYGVLTDEAEVAGWNNEFLPSDRISVENGAIVKNAKRWPLLIDPQLQGVKWIKTREEKNNLRIVQLTQDKYLNQIEAALQAGEPVLIENLGETIDAVLEPVLSRSIIRKGRSAYIKLGDKEVEYDDKFKLYLQTKMSNPHYRPEIAAQTTLINFMVTEEGLEDQLLAVVVNKEKPELEEQRVKLLRDMNQFKIELKRCEDNLLFELSNAKGEILENTALIENLENTKKTAKNIQESVAKAQITSKEISESRELYRPAAVRGSLMFFQIDQLTAIDHMYQYSLGSFMTVFVKALNRAPAAEDLPTRVLSIMDTVTESLFSFVSRGLFERHKLIFATMLCFRISAKSGELDPTHLNFLLRGSRKAGAAEAPESVRDIVTDSQWASIQALSEIEGTDPPFSKLPGDLEGSSRRWKEWCETEKPETEKLPLEYKNLSTFQRLLILRCLRPDRMTMAVRLYVGEAMGKKYVEIPQIPLSASFEDSSPVIPIFFILSPGVDPVKEVERLGKNLGYSADNGKIANVSLGQGQESVAMRELEKAYKNGTWVILNNIHLMSKWLIELDKKVEILMGSYEKGDGEGHADFRLFLSAEPSPKIPMGILQRSIKLTNEPPQGVKANMTRAFLAFSEEIWENSSKQAEFKTVIFSLCFFHAVMVERKKFGAQGWNRNYPFSLGDLTTCINVLNNYLEDRPKIPWQDLRYVFGEIMYGGHITDDWDRRLCSSYLRSYVKEELFEGMELFPQFPVPPGTLSYAEYLEFVDTQLPGESPMAFGLHPNAEIGFLTAQGDNMLRTILELQPRSAAGEGAQSVEERTKMLLDDILERIPEELYNLKELSERLEEERSPFQVVFYQECERMNILMLQIRRTLLELDLGLKGDLTISDKMEQLMNALYDDKVPASWEAVAYPSLRPLGSWLVNLLQRNTQLSDWTSDLQIPKVVWLSGFFNPQSYLTAIMQVTARKNAWPLDRMTLATEVTKKRLDEIDGAAREGAFVRGLFIEGARWDLQAGVLEESKLKELCPEMPIMLIKAIPVEKADFKDYYLCPVYRTQDRGPTYVFACNLKSKANPLQWVLRGVALLLDYVG
eukprot:ANDGO_03199.mRNA.1 Dynein beta chain